MPYIIDATAASWFGPFATEEDAEEWVERINQQYRRGSGDYPVSVNMIRHINSLSEFNCR